jgi:hypothetical protein
MINLEAACAECAKEIVGLARNKKQKARKIENELRKAAGILAENGLYAFFIYLRYRECHQEWNQLAKFLNDQKVGDFSGSFGDDEKTVILVTKVYDQLIFGKDLLRQALIYSLYGLRAVR